MRIIDFPQRILCIYVPEFQLWAFIIKIKWANMTEKITPEDLNRFLLDDSDDENLEMIS
jgi:hypothetical protein